MGTKYVPMDIINTATGQPDIGESLRKTGEIVYECLKSIGGYELDCKGRYFVEEHMFSIDWIGGADEKVEFKLWLPIKKIESSSLFGKDLK